MFRICQGERWSFDGLNLRFERELGDQLLHFVVERTLAPFQIEDPEGSRQAPDHAWAIDAFASGRLRRLPTIADQAEGHARREAARREYAPEQVEALDGRARLRQFVLTNFDRRGQFSLSISAIESTLDELWKEGAQGASELARPPATTVRRWMVERGSPGERPLRQMVSMSGRVPRRRRLHPRIVQKINEAALWYWTTPRVSIVDAYARFALPFVRLNRRRRSNSPAIPDINIPSSETLRKTIRQYECFETYEAKWGAKKAKARFKGAGKGLSAARFLELGCMDHTWLDAVIIDVDHMLPIGRPWLTVIIDVRTRCIVAFVISYEPPSLYQVTECVRRANRPKLHLLNRNPKFPVLAYIFGRFDEVVVDNGWEFSGNAFEDMMADVGSSVRWAPIKSPTYKAIVERFFEILNHLLNRKLPGGVLRPELLREMDYDPSKDAVLTLEELEDLIWDAISYYHIEEHSALGVPPALLWQKDSEAFGIPVIGDDRQLDRMAGAMEAGRKLTRSGVACFGLQFHDPYLTEGLLEDLISLEPVRGQRKGSAAVTVKIKYNPANLAEIHVWNQRRNLYVTLPCTDEKYSSGISLWQHRKIQEWARRSGLEFSTEADRITARAKLVAKIQQSSPALLAKQRRALARLKNTPKIAALSGDGVTLAFAPARHDGMAPTIPQASLASERVDGDRPPKRPPRGGAKKRKAAKGAATASFFPEAEDDFSFRAPVKGFGE
jgi:putative transposase